MSGLRFVPVSFVILLSLVIVSPPVPALSSTGSSGILCGKCRAVADGYFQLCEECDKSMESTVPTGERSEIDFMVMPGRPDPELVRRLTTYSKLMARSRHLRESLRKEPHDWEGLRELAEVSRELDWYAMEAAVLERAKTEFPDRFDAPLQSRLGDRYFYWGRVLMHSREFDKAEEVMGLARKNSVKGPEFDYWTGKLMVAQNNYAEARPFLEKALKDEKLANSANYLLRMAKGCETYGSDSYTAYETGCGLLARGDRSGAILQFERALAINPSMRPASDKLASLTQPKAGKSKKKRPSTRRTKSRGNGRTPKK